MKKIIQVIPIMFLMIVNGFSQFVLSPYLIMNGLIPREALLVTMFGTAAFSFGLLGGWLIAIDNKKRCSQKQSK
jgi:hypothetical protein